MRLSGFARNRHQGAKRVFTWHGNALDFASTRRLSANRTACSVANSEFHRCDRTDADQEEPAAAGFEKFHRRAEVMPQDLCVSVSAVFDF
jgi:hypothetical protein